MAVAGIPRATYDLDVFIEPTRANARRLAPVFKEFGYLELARIAPTSFSLAKQLAAIGRKPLQVDFITTIDGVSFKEAWSSRVEVVADGVSSTSAAPVERRTSTTSKHWSGCSRRDEPGSDDYRPASRPGLTFVKR